jgi:hypothetical protein
MSGYGGRVQPEEWPEDDWPYEPRRERHGPTCVPSNPEIGCECGYAEWETEDRMAREEAEAERIAEMFEARPIGFVMHNGAGEIIFRQAGHPSTDPGPPWRPVQLVPHG